MKKIIKSNDQVTFLRYKIYRDKINTWAAKVRKSTILISSKKQNKTLKKQRKQVNNIIPKGKNKDSITYVKTAKGFESYPILITSFFNDYFTSVAKNLVSKIKTKHNFRQFLDYLPENSMFLSATSAQGVEKCIKSLYRKKSFNIYGMSAKLLKVIANIYHKS